MYVPRILPTFGYPRARTLHFATVTSSREDLHPQECALPGAPKEKAAEAALSSAREPRLLEAGVVREAAGRRKHHVLDGQTGS